MFNIGIRVNFRMSGGGATFFRNLVSALNENDSCRLTLFASPSTMPMFQNIVLSPGSSIVALAETRGACEPIATRSAMREVAREKQLHAVLFPGNECYRLRDVKSIIWPLTVAPFDPLMRTVVNFSTKTRLRYFLLSKTITHSCLQADGMIFSSNYAKDLYSRQHKALNTKPCTTILPSPTLLCEPSGGDDAREIGITDPPVPTILFVSHLYRYKMVVEVIEAFKVFLATIGCPFKLLIAGDSPDSKYADQVRNTISQSGLADSVQLLGNVPHTALQSLYRDCMFFVFPSICENAGSYALIDAMSMGKPILCSSLSSMPEICRDAAMYFDPRNHDRMVRCMLDLARDGAMRNRLAQAARDTASILPSWNESASQLITFLPSVTAT